MGAAPTLIYETLTGSHAYGLAGPSSDVDLRGVIVGPSAWYHGFRGGPEQVEHTADHVWFEIRKLFRLAAQGNWTVLEILWTDPADHRHVTTAGRRLLDARAAFLSRRVAKTFAGYALAQMKRIRTHRGWLLAPPAKEPTRGDFWPPRARDHPEGRARRGRGPDRRRADG
ncbi:MAG: nucleotidyltransferase domain-containing protein [Myxococcota bacterium]